MKEIWRPLIHDEIADGFMLSTYGRIKTKDTEPHEATYHSTNGYDFHPFLLKPTDINGPIIPKIKMYSIDDLLAITFIPIPTELIEKRVKVVHVDGDTRNNRVDNLKWEEDIEEWKFLTQPQDIKQDVYKISNHGRVMNSKRGRLINATENKIGYPVFAVGRHNKPQKWIYVHRAVAHEFMSNCVIEDLEESLVVNHIDGVKTNNHIKNLEYVSRSINAIHAFKAGLNNNIGEGFFNNKISEEEIRHMCQLLVKYKGSIIKTLNELSQNIEYTHITRADIERLKYKKNWASVSDEYFEREQFSNQLIGAGNVHAKMSEDDAKLICEKLIEYNGSVADVLAYMRSINKSYMTRSMVAQIKCKNNWKHISDKYFTKSTFKNETSI